ncbi:MAG: DNA polymerase I [Armatimonadota bacterium]
MAQKKLVVIDGSSLLYRAFFALPALTTADGTPTNAVYGFASMLLKLIEEEKPDILLLAFEGGRTFRHTDFADYKANRPRTPDDLAVQGPLARAVAGVLRIPIVQHTGYEADDVIGTLTCRGRDAGYEVLVVTGDLDALQLVNEHVKVLVNRRGITDAQLYDEAAVRERFGLGPELLPDFKALKGDTSDNIPGVPGIGDKTAATLLQTYGSLERLLEHAEEVKAGKVRENLCRMREQAVLYKKLATVVTDLPLETPWEEWAYPGPDAPEARELFEHLEFRTLARRLPDSAEPAPVAAAREADVSWRVLEAPEEIAEWCRRAREIGAVALRTIRGGGDSRKAVLRGVALSAGGETVLLGGAPAGEGNLFAEVERWSVPEPLRELLRDPSVALLAHDLKAELHALAAGSGGEYPQSPPGFDTLLAAYVLNPGRAAYRLDDLSREHLGWAPAGEELALSAHEAAAVWALREPLCARLKADDLDTVYDELELPLVPILVRMEALGVAVDTEALRGLSERLARRIQEVEVQAFELAGHPFNLGSPKQLQEILFQEQGLPPGKKTKTGYSTDSDVLQDLAVAHPLPALILEYRELSKLKSTYADALRSLVDPRDGRVHTHLNQTVAATGRLSSSDPNLQNIPVRTEVGREIRSAFVPAPGMKLLSADYSQIELRIMAHISRDEALVRAFQENRDVHSATASRVFGVPLEQVTADQRRSAKTVNFAVLYGQKEYGLSRQLRIGVAEAKGLIEAYFERFPGVLGYTEDTLQQARKLGYVTTLPPYRRKRYAPGIHAGNRNERLSAEREAVNAPVQGTASDIIKAAMIRVDAAMRAAGLRSRMILQVHDELLFEIVPEEEAEMTRLVCREMEQAYELSVPLRVEVKVGCNWRDVEGTTEG